MLAMLIGLAGCAPGMEEVAVPVQSVPGSRMPPGPIPAVLVMPEGIGPFPAVIVLHGCDGQSVSQQVWARRLNGWGYAALLPDSFAPRGVADVCAPASQPLVTPQDRAGDVLSAALWLRGQPAIDGARIGVLGFSHGGVTAAWVTQRRYERLYPGLLKASVDYYGDCWAPRTHGTVPLLALAGDDDTWGFPAQSCREFASKLRPGPVFEVHTYPGAVHAFDGVLQRYRIVEEGHPIDYDPTAAQDSFVRVKAFLDRYVKLQGG